MNDRTQQSEEQHQRPVDEPAHKGTKRELRKLGGRRQIAITLILADGAKNRRVIRAKNGTMMMPTDIALIIADHLTIARNAFPERAFEPIALKAGDFNIVERSSQPCAQ